MTANKKMLDNQMKIYAKGEQEMDLIAEDFSVVQISN